MHLSRRATGPGLRSPHHGVGHLEAAVLLQLERRDERAQEEPVHCPVGAARQAEDKPLSLELQGRGGQNPGWPQGPRQAWAPGLNGDAGQQQASLSLSFPVCEEGPRRSHLAGTGGSQEGVLTQGLCRVPSWCRLGVSMVGEAGARAGPRSAQGWLPPPPSQPPDLVLLKTLQDRNDDGRRGLRGLSLRSPQQGKRYPQGAQRPHRCRAEGRSGHRCSRLGLTCLWPHPVPHGRPSLGGVLTPPCSWDWQKERCWRRAWGVLGRRGALRRCGLAKVDTWVPPGGCGQAVEGGGAHGVLRPCFPTPGNFRCTPLAPFRVPQACLVARWRTERPGGELSQAEGSRPGRSSCGNTVQSPGCQRPRRPTRVQPRQGREGPCSEAEAVGRDPEPEGAWGGGARPSGRGHSCPVLGAGASRGGCSPLPTSGHPRRKGPEENTPPALGS